MHRAIHPELFIDDTSLQTVFYDDIVNAAVIGNILRAVAVEYRKNPATGLFERIGICRFARPVTATERIRAEFTRAINAAEGLRLV
jgi:hypothetical protein